MAKILRIDPSSVGEAAIEEIVGVISAGGVVVIPTDTIYGLAASSWQQKAISRIYEIKKRDHSKPFIHLIQEQAQLFQLVRDVPPAVQGLLERFWPGPLTLIFWVREEVLPMGGANGKIALRWPRDPFLERLLAKAGVPLVSTSVNISGQPALREIQEIIGLLGDKVDLVVDAGPWGTGLGSTIVDVTVEPPILLREGSIRLKELLEVTEIKPGL